jgi:hypothetical protein
VIAFWVVTLSACRAGSLWTLRPIPTVPEPCKRNCFANLSINSK